MRAPLRPRNRIRPAYTNHRRWERDAAWPLIEQENDSPLRKEPSDNTRKRSGIFQSGTLTKIASQGLPALSSDNVNLLLFGQVLARNRSGFQSGDRLPGVTHRIASKLGKLREMTEETPKRRRGFASLTPEQRKALGSLGGRSVNPENRSFSRDKDLARKAGEIGGRSVPAEKRAFSADRNLASRAGKMSSSAQPKV